MFFYFVDAELNGMSWHHHHLLSEAKNENITMSNKLMCLLNRSTAVLYLYTVESKYCTLWILTTVNQNYKYSVRLHRYRYFCRSYISGDDTVHDESDRQKEMHTANTTDGWASMSSPILVSWID